MIYDISKMLWKIVGLCFIADNCFLGGNVSGLKQYIPWQTSTMLSYLDVNGKIADKCNENGGKQAADDFWLSLYTTQDCFGKNTIFVTAKDEYLGTIKNCTSDLVSKSEVCLSEEAKYYPSLFMETVESLIEFAYDHLNLKTLSPRSEIVHCLQKLKSVGIKESFDLCIQFSSPPECANFTIPNKTEICKQWVGINECFNNFVKKTCIRDIAVDRFLTNLTAASKKPCRNVL